MFVSPAYAQAGASGPSGLESLIPLILIVVVFYFFLIRPQQQKQKEHKSMLGAIRRGDKVVTGGGIYGVVKKVIDEGELQVEIAEGVRVRVRRDLVASVLSKSEPVPESKGPSKPSKTEKSDAADAAADKGQGGIDLKNLFSGKKK